MEESWCKVSSSLSPSVRQWINGANVLWYGRRFELASVLKHRQLCHRKSIWSVRTHSTYIQRYSTFSSLFLHRFSSFCWTRSLEDKVTQLLNASPLTNPVCESTEGNFKAVKELWPGFALKYYVVPWVRSAIWVVDSGGPKEPCITWGPDPPCKRAILRGKRGGPL